MTDEQIISATEASRSFSDMLHRVCYGGEAFIIKKGQRLMARITPVEAPISENQIKETKAATPDTTLLEMFHLQELTPVGEDAEYYEALLQRQNKPILDLVD